MLILTDLLLTLYWSPLTTPPRPLPWRYAPARTLLAHQPWTAASQPRACDLIAAPGRGRGRHWGRDRLVISVRPPSVVQRVHIARLPAAAPRCLSTTRQEQSKPFLTGNAVKTECQNLTEHSWCQWGFARRRRPPTRARSSRCGLCTWRGTRPASMRCWTSSSPRNTNDLIHPPCNNQSTRLPGRQHPHNRQI